MTEPMELVDAEMHDYSAGLVANLCRRANLRSYAKDAEQVARITLWQFAAKWDQGQNDNFGKAAYPLVYGRVIDFLRSASDYSRHKKCSPLHVGYEEVSTDRLRDSQESVEMRLCRSRLPVNWESYLDERERLIVRLYFWEEVTMREIGKQLGIDESRVSQVMTRAMRRLRERACRVRGRAGINPD